MEPTRHRVVARTALLLALTLLFQSLRFIIPVPPFFSTWIIGSLVNACLLVALETTGLYPAVVIAVTAPVVAYLQMLLPLPVFVVPVALANILYVSLFKTGLAWGRWQGITLAALGKTIFLYCAFAWLLTLIHIDSKLANGLLFVMSWPQLVTTVAGGVLATMIVKRLRPWLDR
ncbi:MAG: hypothetical protein P4N59_02360 [Negativicutes bacterium]|nr:hypothetical protein [Negativicutes bacterium]